MTKILLLLLLLSGCLFANAQQALRLPRFFADGMVLQRDAKNPVWGWGPVLSVDVPEGLNTTTLRYCWDDYPTPTLYNADGIPAPQFEISSKLSS